MTDPDALARAAAALVRELPPATVDAVLRALDAPGASVKDALACGTASSASARLEAVVDAARATKDPPAVVAAMLRGARAALVAADSRERVELVWTGPNPLASALYRTEQTLLAMIKAARASVLVVTFAAYKVDAIREALRAAAERGARVDLVTELGAEAGGKVSVSPTLALLAGAHPNLRAFAWPVEHRPRRDDGTVGSLHAKCAVVDDDQLLVSSANLTSAALELNMELGVLLRGGSAPRRVHDHFAELIRRHVLRSVDR